jgi:hypothetical protein
MTRCLSVALPAGLAVLGLCGCVFVAKPNPKTDSGQQGDRPVYVVVQGPEDSPPNVKTTHEGAPDKPAHAPPPPARVAGRDEAAEVDHDRGRGGGDRGAEHRRPLHPAREG